MKRMIRGSGVALLTVAAGAICLPAVASETSRAMRDSQPDVFDNDVTETGTTAADAVDLLLFGSGQEDVPEPFRDTGLLDNAITQGFDENIPAGDGPVFGKKGEVDRGLAGLITSTSELPTEPPQDLPDPAAVLAGCADNPDPSCLTGGGEPDEPATPSEDDQVATDSNGAMIALAATGTVTAADEECTVSVTSLTFNYTAADTFTAFNGESAPQTFRIECGVDRTESANFKIGTNEDASDSTVSGTVTADGGDVQPVNFTVLDADTGEAISSTSDVSARNDESRDVDVLLSFDKNQAKGGGSVELDDGQFLYVILDDSSSLPL